MIGDPGGRDSERSLLPKTEVERAVGKIREQARRFLDFDCGETSAEVVNNIDWTEELGAIDYLRDIGKHFSVNEMIRKESVRRRLEDADQGISYTEFSYMLLQSYDFVVLNRRYNCTIQLGGSDQWGNITAGIDLVRRMEAGRAYAMTFPLVTRADGTKFGKSAGAAIWLDSGRTSPYRFFQFWRNTADDDVMKFIRMFTFLGARQIQTLEKEHRKDPGLGLAQVTLAREMTRLVHGDDGLAAAERITDALFAGGLEELGETDFAQLALDGMDASRLKGPTLVDALVESGLASTPRGKVTRGQARKLIRGNGISVNGRLAVEEEMRLTPERALYGKYFVIRKGKKSHHLVVI